MAETKNQNKIDDVTKPGQTAPTSTSRPVIVGHTAETKQDPMVAVTPAPKSRETVAEPPKPLEPHREATIQPLTETTIQPVETEPAPTETPEVKPDTSGAVDSIMGDIAARQADKKDKEELSAKMAEMEESIQSKEFFVPLGQVTRRRSNRRIVAGLILFVILALTATNFAIDADVIDAGVNALTDLL